MAEHTQGRWHVKRGRGIGCSYAILVGTDDANVACVRDIRRFNPDGNFPPDAWNEVEANARLIAAAPKMLEALQNALPLLAALTSETDDIAMAVRSEMEEAIAIAKSA